MNTDLKLINLSPADLVDLSEAIQEFNEALPGWRLALSHADQRGSALCVPEENGPDAKLRLESDERFSRGFIWGLSSDSAAQGVRTVTADAVRARQIALERLSSVPTIGAFPKLVHVSADDWEAIYLDGELLSEDHSIGMRWVAEHMKNKPFVLESMEASSALLEYVGENGCFPALMSEFPSEAVCVADKHVVFTGTMARMSRADMEDHARSLGAKTSESVSTKTDYLVVGANPGSKLAKAQAAGVTILSEEEWFALVGVTQSDEED